MFHTSVDGSAASTKLEAEQEAYAVFKAHTPREKSLITVRPWEFNGD